MIVNSLSPGGWGVTPIIIDFLRFLSAVEKPSGVTWRAQAQGPVFEFQPCLGLAGGLGELA